MSNVHHDLSICAALVEIDHVRQCEMDNHGNTPCFGVNFLHCTGKVCDVTPFSDEYDPMNDVKIAGAVWLHMMTPIVDCLISCSSMKDYDLARR